MKHQNRGSNLTQWLITHQRKPLGELRNRFIIAGDTHFGEFENTNYHQGPNYRWAQDYEERIQKLVSWVNTEHSTNNVDAFVLLGDVVYNQPNLLPTVKGYLDNLNVPYYVAHGNHDHATDAEWFDIFGYDRSSSFAVGDTVFILPNTGGKDGQYLQADVEWIRNEVEQYPNARNIIIGCHIPQNISSGFAGVVNNQFVSFVVGHPKIKLVLYGHTHMFNDTIKKHGISYVWCDHLGVHGIPYHGYRVVEVHENGVKVYAKTSPYNSDSTVRRNEFTIRN